MSEPIIPGLDDIDVMSIRADIDTDVRTKKVITKIEVRKPKPLEFIRVHPEWTYPCRVLEDQTEGLNPELWLIAPQIAPLIEADMIFVVLYCAINRRGQLFLLKVKEGNMKNTWVRTLYDGVQAAKLYWVKIRANNPMGRYDVDVAEERLSEPEWPEIYTVLNNGKLEDRPVNIELLIKLAFKDRYVADPSHEVVKKVRGMTT